jgi:tellurite resistance protein TerC
MSAGTARGSDNRRSNPLQDIVFWAAFGVIIAAALAFDLGVVGRKKGTIGVTFAAWLSVGYIALALAFGAGVYLLKGHQEGLEYFAGYALEKSLSLDNIFVFVVIFSQMKVPAEARHKVLFWGVIGALVMRAGMIFAGAALLHAMEWMIFVFGAIVIASGLKLLFRKDEPPDPEDNRLLRLLRRWLPMTKQYDGRRFLTTGDDGKRYATPLMAALVVVESSDLLFALDSIPAIFGITRDPFIVYTSNAFAILGLRALFFAVAGLIDKLRYLHYGLALLLVLIGIKMIVGEFVEIPVWVTLGGTVLLLAATTAASLLRRDAT